MALAIHNNRTDNMDYGFKDDVPREHWVYYDAFIVWKACDKFPLTYVESNSSESQGISRGNFGGPRTDLREVGNPSTPSTEDDPGTPGSDVILRSTPQTRRGSMPGRKAAKSARLEAERHEARMQSENGIVEAMKKKAEQTKRRTELLEESNALLASSSQGAMETPAHDAQRMEFIRLTRQVHLQRLRARLAQSTGQDSGPPPAPQTESNAGNEDARED